MKDKLDPDKMPTWLMHEFIDTSEDSAVIYGINEDDCAILQLGNEQFVITTDFLNASPIAVELGICSLWDLGRLLVAANLSDLCGSGAKPLAMLAGIKFERGASAKEFMQLMNGIKHELSLHQIPLVGGDTKLGKSKALLGVAIGCKEQGSKLFVKSNAMPGEEIWVSGEIGSVSAAIDGLTNFSMNIEWDRWAKKVLIEPNLPLNKSREIALAQVGRAGTDLSDGLGADLQDLCLSSGVGAVIEPNSIPIHENVKTLAGRRNIPPWLYPLIIGGDFQFIVTGHKSSDKRFINAGFRKIGVVTEAKEIKVKVQSKEAGLPIYGHEDGRQMTFSEEVNFILNQLKKDLVDVF